MKDEEDTPEQLKHFNSQPYVNETANAPAVEHSAFDPWHPLGQPAPNNLTDKKRRRRKILITGLILLAIAALAETVNFLPYLRYQTYQQGRCTIQTEDVNYVSSKNSSYYTPIITYILQTNDGRLVSTSGYQLPFSPQFSTYSDAQQANAAYAIGQTYPCWYYPADPTHAALIFHGYSLQQVWTTYFATLPIFFVLLILFYVPTYNLVFGPLYMLTRGIRTQGEVIAQFTKPVRTKGGLVNRAFSRIAFQTSDDPTRTWYVEPQAKLPVGSQQLVLYDPKNPGHAQQGRGGCVLAFGICLSLFLLGIVLVVLLLFASV
jgi:hypothetical protein